MIKQMINDSIMGFRLTKYGLKVKLQLGMAAFFFAIGLFIDIMSKGSSYIAGFYVVLAGMFIFQCIISMDASTLIQSSGYKKKIQTSFPYMAVIPLVTVFYTILAVAHGIMAGYPIDGRTLTESYNIQVAYLFAMSILLFITLLYFGICYKFFMVGMILLIATIMPLSMFISKYEEWIFSTFSLSQVIILGYILIAVGFVVSVLLSKAFYRKPLSRLAVRVSK